VTAIPGRRGSPPAPIRRRGRLRCLLWGCLAPWALPPLLWSGTLPAHEPDQRPAIAIILDDMGNNRRLGEEALKLPAGVTLSFLPHTPHTKELAQRAHRQGNEIMLHLPMEAEPARRLGPGGLTGGMTEAEFLAAVRHNLAAVPHIVGVNNHMGSRLTAERQAMQWLMHELRRRGDLFFVDSRTSPQTLAGRLAVEHDLPSAGRDIFLDNERNTAAIRRQFNLLLSTARRRGVALAIGHPHPETLAVLAEELQRLPAEEIQLVAVTRIIELEKERRKQWLAPSSPSLKVAKN
jgi:uncharacterized protein